MKGRTRLGTCTLLLVLAACAPEPVGKWTITSGGISREFDERQGWEITAWSDWGEIRYRARNSRTGARETFVGNVVARFEPHAVPR